MLRMIRGVQFILIRSAAHIVSLEKYLQHLGLRGFGRIFGLVLVCVLALLLPPVAIFLTVCIPHRF